LIADLIPILTVVWLAGCSDTRYSRSGNQKMRTRADNIGDQHDVHREVATKHQASVHCCRWHSERWNGEISLNNENGGWCHSPCFRNI